ncbi:hypothetical protein PG997_009962 [Apiospora hydei]|uniref:Uncharacterized protein n=1 Tax=Apiospora hydei TaxID=1337664 RepID=A0ABR1VVN3_9PEZI
MSNNSGQNDKPDKGDTGDKPNSPNKSDESIHMGDDLKLIMAVFEHMHPEFGLEDWDNVAAKRGITKDDAQKRFAAIRDRYDAVTQGETLPKPVIKRRNRGGKRAADPVPEDKDDG